MSWGQDGLIGRTQLGLGAPQTSAGLAQRAGGGMTPDRKTGRFGIWRYSPEVRKAESELKVQGQDLLASQDHQASQETCEDRGGERYMEAQPRDPAGPPVASVVLTDRAESPERSSRGSRRGLLGEPGLDLPSQDALGSISITGSRPTAGQGAWELHATGHLHQGSDCGSCGENALPSDLFCAGLCGIQGLPAQPAPAPGPRSLGYRVALLSSEALQSTVEAGGQPSGPLSYLLKG